jgi:hypothetical protein
VPYSAFYAWALELANSNWEGSCKGNCRAISLDAFSAPHERALADPFARAPPRISWRVAHEALSGLARERAAADAEEGCLLIAAQRSAAHVHLGFACFSQYIERLFGYQPRSTQEKLRMAEALEELSATGHALSSGELDWSATRELTPVAVRESQREWLAFARGKTVRQLQELSERAE